MLCLVRFSRHLHRRNICGVCRGNVDRVIFWSIHGFRLLFLLSPGGGPKQVCMNVPHVATFRYRGCLKQVKPGLVGLIPLYVGILCLKQVHGAFLGNPQSWSQSTTERCRMFLVFSAIVLGTSHRRRVPKITRSNSVSGI